jgi:hypothetical protein
VKLLLGLALMLGLACGDSITVPYNQYVGIVGTFELASVNNRPLPSDTGVFLSARYVIDSGRIVIGDSLFKDELHYKIIDGAVVTPASDVLVGTYRVDGNNVRFYANTGFIYNVAFLNGSMLVEVYGDGHTLIYNKR